MPPYARPAAALIVLLALASLWAQGVAAGTAPGLDTALAVLWRLAAFFTVLTNGVALAVFAVIAAGRPASAFWCAGVALWLGLVALTYHVALADLRTLEGLSWWADLGLHSAMPVAAAAWWLAFAPKAGLGVRMLPGWIAWPALYASYAILRGTLTGFWAYPFLDLSELGTATVALNLGVMLAIFAAAGLALVALARALR